LIGSGFPWPLQKFPTPSPPPYAEEAADEDEDDEGEDVSLRLSSVFCSVRAHWRSATGARMIHAQSSDSQRSILLP
jgi:hypothetical protein